MEQPSAKKTASIIDMIALTVGVVVGAGIFRTPSVVAANSGGEAVALSLWVLGGVVSFIGALCYAELGSSYPHSGGEYHYLRRAFGSTPAFLFAWSRMTVIQTGSIATLAFLIGDYATRVFSLGPHSSALYAAALVVAVTGINLAGVRQGLWTQKLLTTAIITGLLVIAGAGLIVSSPPQLSPPPAPATLSGIGSAMVFVMFTYGGWNEAAYLSAEVRGSRTTMARGLLASIGVVTAVYLIVNIAMIEGLGLAAVGRSEAVAADLMRGVFGETGARFISLLIVIAAASTMNGVIITGARTNHALGRDYPLFSFMGCWRERGSTPANALIVQGAVSLLLVAAGAFAKNGFVMMVEYTAPVFWLFFLATGLSLMRLRGIDPGTERPFRTPLYPAVPLLFCAFCLYMLYASMVYTGVGALMGVLVLLAGALPLGIAHHLSKARRAG